MVKITIAGYAKTEYNLFTNKESERIPSFTSGTGAIAMFDGEKWYGGTYHRKGTPSPSQHKNDDKFAEALNKTIHA